MTQPPLTILLCIVTSFTFFSACVNSNDEPEQDSSLTRTADKTKRLPGKDDTLDPKEIQQGKVLIAYADCYTCHSIDTKAKGPSFHDIAKRYPANKGYIELLAQKIIIGGSRAWGYPIMAPHPDLSEENAKLMVKFILSLNNPVYDK